MKSVLVAIAITAPSVSFAQDNDGTSADFFTYNFWTLLFGLLILVLSGVLLYWNKRFSRMENKIHNIKRAAGQQAEPVTAKMSNDINNLLEEINKINNRLKPAPIPQAQVTNPVSGTEGVFRASEERATVIELKVPEKSKQEVFYMATPNDDGSFDAAGRSNEFRATQSLYRFTSEAHDTTKATFCFYSDEAGLQDAVNYPHTYISPVCEPQNALNQNARSIRTIRPGFAEKRNDKWVVTVKTQISYE